MTVKTREELIDSINLHLEFLKRHDIKRPYEKELRLDDLPVDDLDEIDKATTALDNAHTEFVRAFVDIYCKNNL